MVNGACSVINIEAACDSSEGASQGPGRLIMQQDYWALSLLHRTKDICQ